NAHKVEEIRAALPDTIKIITLAEAGLDIDIPEPHDTLEMNAAEKARTIFHLTGQDCFADDTGLEVPALGGAPGVKSARYAGEGKSFSDNVDKLLKNMEGISDRRARFRAVFCLRYHDGEKMFEGICEGGIIDHPKGTHGFGYDPVFVPSGADRTFAEMTLAEKNAYSHRKRALEKLVLFLNNLTVNEQY
ncbi:MAG TPA: RdgB/HAM1 family non-canonical purine NTP pyrophosphatase, partial [Flavisolibacter sp.]